MCESNYLDYITIYKLNLKLFIEKINYKLNDLVYFETRYF
jgi:hypothetical protein